MRGLASLIRAACCSVVWQLQEQGPVPTLPFFVTTIVTGYRPRHVPSVPRPSAVPFIALSKALDSSFVQYYQIRPSSSAQIPVPVIQSLLTKQQEKALVSYINVLNTLPMASLSLFKLEGPFSHEGVLNLRRLQLQRICELPDVLRACSVSCQRLIKEIKELRPGSIHREPAC